MDGTEPAIVDLPKGSNDIVSDTMIVEETENSSSFTQSKEVIVIFLSTCIPIWQLLKCVSINVSILQVMDNVDIDLVNVPKEATTLGHEPMLLEGTKTEKVHIGAVSSRHNKPKKKNTRYLVPLQLTAISLRWIERYLVQ
jgi:hypothetical protein